MTRSIRSVWAEVFSQAAVGKPEDAISYLSLPCLRGKPGSSRVESVLFTALLCSPPTKQGGLSISCWTQNWCTKSAFWTAHSIGQVSACVTLSLFLWVSSQVHRSRSDPFSSLSTQLHVDLSYSFGCTGVLLPVCSLYSVRIALHDVLLMCLWEEVSSKSSYSTILIWSPLKDQLLITSHNLLRGKSGFSQIKHRNTKINLPDMTKRDQTTWFKFWIVYHPIRVNSYLGSTDL